MTTMYFSTFSTLQPMFVHVVDDLLVSSVTSPPGGKLDYNLTKHFPIELALKKRKHN